MLDYKLSDPPPMPNIRGALIYIPDAKAALERANNAWNAAQLKDALNSAKVFIALAEKAIEDFKKGN